MHRLTVTFVAMMLAPFALWAPLYALSEVGNVNLKPLKPWLMGLSWLLWGGGLIGQVLDRHWAFWVVSAESASGLLLYLLQRRYLFENNVRPSRSLGSVLTIPQPTYVAVRDVLAASDWYADKFGLRKLAPTEELRPDGVTLQFGAETHPLVLVPRDPAEHRPVPMFFTRSVKRARKRLMEDGLSIGPVQQDRQGTHFFELQDSEGNTLEVSERP